MLKEFFERRKEKKAIKEWYQSPLGQALLLHTQEYFSYPRLSELTQETQDIIKTNLMQHVMDVVNAENPFIALRDEIAGQVLIYSEYQVLCLTEEEKKEFDFSNCPYISGELYKDIDKADKYMTELDEFKWKNPDITNEQLISYCNSKSLVSLYYMNGINLLRREFDDYDDEKDWFKPFIESQLIAQEYLARDKMELPQLIGDSIEYLKYSTFLNLVRNGHENPLYEWEKGLREIEEM